MAKRKTKKEEVIDFTKPEKIDEQELARLQATIRTIDQITNDVGMLEVRKYSAMKAMGTIQENIEALRKDFREKYGTDNINIQTGEISYPGENLNPKENGEINKKD
jgi:glutamyl-tRNA reductase